MEPGISPLEQEETGKALEGAPAQAALSSD